MALYQCLAFAPKLGLVAAYLRRTGEEWVPRASEQSHCDIAQTAAEDPSLGVQTPGRKPKQTRRATRCSRFVSLIPVLILALNLISPSLAAANTRGFTLPKLVALHIRRGDYEGHCKFLSSVGAMFHSWSKLGLYSTNTTDPPPYVEPSNYHIEKEYMDPTFPKLPDSLYSPPYTTYLPKMDEPVSYPDQPLKLNQLAMMHCWPTLSGIRDKLAVVRKLHPGVEDVYLMTNGNQRWVGGLIELLKEDGWNNVRSSLELDLVPAAVAVSQALDMAIANWAQVFVGVGVCRSFSLLSLKSSWLT